jgi:hypothetical protein
MARQFKYDIRQFRWSKLVNTFFADAWDLVAWQDDGLAHPESFPGMKKYFYIKNYETGGERRFEFVKEFENIMDNEPWSETIWQFISEDGILCNICVSTT